MQQLEERLQSIEGRSRQLVTTVDDLVESSTDFEEKIADLATKGT